MCLMRRLRRVRGGESTLWLRRSSLLERIAGVLGGEGGDGCAICAVVGVGRSLLRRETLGRGVVHALRVVGRLLSVERHALLRNGLVVGLELRLQLNLVRGASAAGLNGPVVEAGASVLVNHNGIGDPRDEKEETAQMLSATGRRGRGRGGTHNSRAPRPAMPATTPP